MIQNITIHNFKKFEQFSCKLADRISLIAGPNNSGKSTLLQAIALWSEIWEFLDRNNSLNGNLVEMDISALRTIPISSFQELWYNRDTSTPITIQLGLDKGNIGFEVRYQTPYKVEVGPLEDTYIGLRLLKEKSEKAFYITPLSSLEIKESHFITSVLQIRLAHGKGGEIIRNLLIQISEDEEKWQTLQSTVEDFFGYELLIPSGVDPINARYRHSSAENANNLINGASGFLQVVLLQSALLLSSRDTIFLIDEPDAHLHNLLKGKIYRLIRKHCSDTNSQAVMASHSSRLIDEADEHNLFCVTVNGLKKVEKKLAKNMSNIPNQDILHAESFRRILYLEGKSDLDNLFTWARTLNHPAKSLLDRVFWVATAEKDAKNKGHFQVLKTRVPDLMGLEIRDSDGKEHSIKRKGPQGMEIAYWNRYEIENYLIHPSAIVRFISQKFSNDKSKEVEKQIRLSLPGALIDNPLSEEINYHRVNGGKRILREILTRSGLIIPESKFYEIAEVMEEKEIHPDVLKMLDLIEEQLGGDPYDLIT